MSGVRMLYFLQEWWKFIQTNLYYSIGPTMVLRSKFPNSNVKFLILRYANILQESSAQYWKKKNVET